MLFINLATIVKLGYIFLIVCHFLLIVIEVDCKPSIRNQVSAFKLERRNMKDDVTPRLSAICNKPSIKKSTKKLPRRRRNFIDKVKMCYNLPITTITSTCTPFFIRRKVTHRKAIRLKETMHWNTMQVDNTATNELLLQKQSRGKIRNFFFNKHTSTPILLEMDNSDFSTGKNKNKHKTTISLELLEPSSEKIALNKSGKKHKHGTSPSTNVLNVVGSENTLAYELPLSKKYTHMTLETDLPISETTAKHLSIEPFTTGSGRTKSYHSSSESLPTLTNKTTNPANVSPPKTNILLKKLHLEKIFHFSKAPSVMPSESNETKNVHSGDILQYLRTLPVTHLISNKTTETGTRIKFLAKNKESATYLPTDSIQKKIPVHHRRKDFSTLVFTGKPKVSTELEPVLEQTTEILETQIPPSLNQRTMQKGSGDYKSESHFPTSTGFYGILTKNDTKNMHFWNMLHMHRKTTSDKVINSAEQQKNSNFGFKNTVFHSETESKSNTQTDSYQDYENPMTYRFNFKNRKFIGGNHSSSDSNEKKVSEKNSSAITIGLRIKSEEKSNKKPENSETTTVHNPFKIKYLMKFKDPTFSTESNDNKSSMLNLTTENTCNEEEALLSTKELNSPVENTPTAINYQPRLDCDMRASSQLVYGSIQNKNKYTIPKTSLQGITSTTGQNYENKEQLRCYDHTTFSTPCSKDRLKFKEIVGFKKYKAHCKNKNHKHNNGKPINHGLKESHKQACCNKTSTENFLNVTVFKTKSGQFRDWFFGKTTVPVSKKYHKSEQECTFRWCFRPINNNRSTIGSKLIGSYPLKSSSEDFSTVSEKKSKHFFNFRSSFNPSFKDDTTTVSAASIDNKVPTKIKPTQHNAKTKKYYEKSQTVFGKINSQAYSPQSSSDQEPPALTSREYPIKYESHSKVSTVYADLKFSDTFRPNVSIKVYGRGKVQQFLHRFYTGNTTFNPKKSEINSLRKGNGSSLLLNPEYADYIETKVETKKHKKHSNRTALHNASDVNDTSVNIMAYVMKPFDSLVSVFKALSPISVTKIGDINATVIKNGSLPQHLQPPNSSIVILAVNNTNTTSRDVHESKLGLALDLLGGMYHCVFNTFVEAKPEDVHFYLYTRNNLEEPEELYLPESLHENNVTSTTDVPQPVLEKAKLDSTMGKREIGDYEDDQDLEFEALNPAKSEIQSKWFNVNADTKVLIHGYLQDYQTDIMVSMREAYLSQGPYNVVVVDWSVLVGDSSCYPVVASRGLRQVGSLLAQLLNRLIEAGVSPSSIHMVGFSLGAHVAGHAGTLLDHGLVSRITGLDPALPYVPMEPDMSLDLDDAAFVDIIHSAAGLLGQSGPMGHVDFYPNGGSQQPGCEVSSLSCSHRRAALYFIESINSDYGFQATKCDSWHHFQADNCTYPAKTLMGEPCPSDVKGKFYLVTGYRSPFAIPPEDNVKVKKSLLLDLFYDSEYL